MRGQVNFKGLDSMLQHQTQHVVPVWSMSITIHNLITANHVIYINYKPLDAVVHQYCQDKGLQYQLSKHTTNGTLQAFYATLPIVKGKVAISCGEWACRLM